MRGKWIGLSIVIATAIAGAGIVIWQRQKPVATQPAVNATAASTPPASITVAGKIRAAHVTGAGSDLMGTIDLFQADVGDEVSQGQALAQVGSAGLENERAEAAAAVEKAQTRVDAAEKMVAAAQLEESRAKADRERARIELERMTKLFDRQKTLFAAGATPRLTYEKTSRDWDDARQQWEALDNAAQGAAERVRDTRREVDNAKRILDDQSRQLEALQRALESAVVESPVDGLVVGRQGALGDPVQRFGNDLFSIATDLYDLELAAETKPDAAMRLRPGMPALVVIPDLQGSSFPGTIKAIDGNLVVIGFQSPTPVVRPGMPAEAHLRPE